MNDLNMRITKKYLSIIMIILASVVMGINLLLSYIAVNNAFSLHINNAKSELEIFSEEISNRTASVRKLGTQIFQDPDIEVVFNKRNIDDETVLGKFEERLNFYADIDYYLKSLHIYSSYADVWYSIENTSVGRAISTNSFPERMKGTIKEHKNSRNGFLNEENSVPVYTFIVYPFARSENVIVMNYNINYFDVYNKSAKCAYMVLDSEGRLVLKDSNYGTDTDNEIYEYILKKSDDKESVWFSGKYVVIREKSGDREYYSITNSADFLGRITPTVASAIVGSLIMIILVVFCFTSAMTWMLEKFGQYYWYAESTKNEIKERSNRAELKAYIKGEGVANIKMVTKLDKSRSCVVFRIYIRDLEKHNVKDSADEKRAINYAVRNVLLELIGDINAEVLKIGPEDIAVLCNADDGKVVYENIMQTKSVIEDSLNMKMTVVKHRNSVDFSAVPAMYDKLVAVGEKSFFVGPDTVIDASDYDNAAGIDTAALLEKIERAVSLGNALEARDALRTDDIMNMSVYDAKGFAISIVKRLYTRSTVLSEQKHKAIESIANEINDYINSDCDWNGIVGHLGILFENMVELSKYNSEEYNREKYDQMIKLIHEHYSEDGFSRNYIAEETKMSIKSMEQIFKRRENKSITNYIHEYRMAKAKELLDQSDYSIKKIAEKVGYSNVSHFIQNFKKTYSITPDKYRKNR
ncbi:MAG: helix-turn-helix transcriptional regulator [Clostridia bacterium]|nr:helix-turn-helix transcriptional regulator [Clostridia bacterium]